MSELDETLPLDDSKKLDGEFENEYHNHHVRYKGFDDIGSGGTGTVVKVHDPNLQRQVALKFLNKQHNESFENRTRFIREAQIMAQIAHPNILPVYELGTDSKDNLYYTMKYIEGSTLSEIIAKLKVGDPEVQKNFGRARLIDIFVDICQGVSFSHSNNVIHRDLKPANIVIGAFGEVQILDWGLAKVLMKDDENSYARNKKSLNSISIEKDQFDLTINDVVVGTPIYMSPEQAKGEVAALDELSDVYTLGCILYELLTCDVTVNADSIKEVFKQITSEVPIEPRVLKPEYRISPELNAICMKCLEKEKEKRYQSVNEIIADIHEFKEGRSVTAYNASLHERFLRLCKRHPAISSTILGVLIVSVIAFSAMKLAFNMHLNKMMTMANHHKMIGDSLFITKMKLTNELILLRNTGTNKDDVQKLRNKIQKTHKHCESNYEVAYELYSHFAPHNFKVEKSNAIRSIFVNRIKYYLLTKEVDEVRKNIQELENWDKKGVAKNEINKYKKALLRIE